VNVKESEERHVRASYKDIERAAEVVAAESDLSKNASTDDNMVWWDGEDDPANPLNWRTMKKWNHVGIVSLITFVV
jgi:hypothetical protein